MEIIKFEDRESWMLGRRGKITGSRLKDVVMKKVGAGKKIGFYELIAERLGVPASGENAMDRGTRLEEEALDRFTEETGMELDKSLVMWVREDDKNLAVSPDASVVGKPFAVESKCLSSARHIEAFITKKIPDEYEYQKFQYFIVNDDLEALYFAFYDPRVLVKPFFYIMVTREDVEEEIKDLLEYEKDLMQQVTEIVNQLTF